MPTDKCAHAVIGRHAVRVFAVALLALTLSGCADFPSLRIEQVIPVNDHVRLILSTGTKFSIPDSPAWLGNLRYYLVEYSLDGPTCPAALPLRAVDLNDGLAPLTQKAGLRVDFFLGDNPDRVVRVVRQGEDDRQVHSDIAVLGPSADGKWEVLDSWSKTEPADRRSIIPSIDGRFLVFTTAPMRVFDTRSMKSFDAPAELVEMVDAIFASTTQMPADFLFTEELMGLQASVHRFQSEPSLKIREGNLEVERGSSRVTEHDEDEILLYRKGKMIHTKWADWIHRRNESFWGNDGGDPLGFGVSNYAWDLDAHTLEIPPGPPPPCWNANQLWTPAMRQVAVFHVASASGAQPGTMRVVDLSFPFTQRGKGFDFVGIERAMRNRIENGSRQENSRRF